MTVKAEAKASKRWAKERDFSRTWFCFPPTQAYLREWITGDPSLDNYQWTVAVYLKGRTPVPRCLSLCCGHGHVERMLADLGTFQECLGLDISPEAIESASRQARERGYTQLRYEVADINAVRLQPEHFDLIVANGALHHIARLEDVVAEVHAGLKPGGVLIANEYIGPDYGQLPNRQKEIINSVLHLIPRTNREAWEGNFIPHEIRNTPWGIVRRGVRKLRRMLGIRQGPPPDSPQDANAPFIYGKIWEPLPVKVWRKDDPSESVRSSEVIPVMRQHFPDLIIRYFGGSLLQYVFDGRFFDTYDPTNRRDQLLVELLIRIEKTLIEMGELPHDYAHIVARKV